MTATVRSELMDLRQAASLALWAAIEQTLTGWVWATRPAPPARPGTPTMSRTSRRVSLPAPSSRPARWPTYSAWPTCSPLWPRARTGSRRDPPSGWPPAATAQQPPRQHTDSTPGRALASSAAAEPNVADALLGAALAVETAVAPLPVAHAGVTAGLIATARAAAERVVLDAAGHSLLAAARMCRLSTSWLTSPSGSRFGAQDPAGG